MACSGEGLSTSEALSRLHEDIATSLDEYQKSEAEKNKGFGLKSVLYEAFHHKSYISVFRWTSALALIVEGVVLLVAFAACNDPRYHHLPAESFFIVVAVMLNVYLVWWDTQLRHKELPRLTQNVLNDLKEFQSSVLWCAENYPHLHSPMSPCITLQWTRRDGHTVNLPWSLLVRGDIIYLKPGQKVPARCKPMQTSYTGGGGEILMGDIYSPNLEGVGEGFSSPKARTPLKAAPYVLLETPYITNLKILLTEALNRPVTVFNKQRFYLFSWAMESVILPVVLGLILVINALRVYYGNWVGDWTEALLIGPVCVAFPLIPLGLPLAWLLLNWLGIARILTMYHHANKLQSDPVEDPFEDAELEALQFSEMSVKWLELRRHFILTICGKEPSPIRTANVLHVLASVTNLCCVDKKGVLSWPNPTAEKVFFLKNRAHNLASSAPSLYGDNVMFEEVKAEKVTSSNPTKESESVLMSLTHDHQTAFGLQFDDPMWRRYLLSLKPLGLNILLNTCNPATQKHYTQFCAHITCEAMYNEDLVPVSQRSYVEHGCEHRHVVHMDIPVCSRGCLCELAKQIGFSEQAQEPFELEHQLSTFRHVPPDMACKDRLARSLMITKLKFPFPHMVSVLVRDRASRKLELMSQGTADIVLDSCTDYWDGYDICPLTDKDRKKILDFYHRTSLSAYCTAFSYRPTSCVVRGNLTNIYMELPIDPTHLYNAARTPTPHISTEALFGDEEHTEYEEIDDIDDAFRMQCKQIFIGMVTMQYQAKTDMVQMIEQLDASCIRFVHFSKENELRSRVFSEKMGLESGWNCHISLLSDRTRTESGNSSGTGAAGSIKTSGLTLYRQSTEDITSPHLSKTRFRHDRSQWRNCQSTRFCVGTRTAHAWRSSLEVSRALSHSAPSAINLEVAQVKFEEEVSICSEFSQSQTSYLEDEDDQRLGGFGYNCPGGTSEECMIVADEEHMCNAGDTNSEHHSHVSGQSRSPSRGTDSTEHSASFNFDMSNRARLPKGIENIKPHLENVDNVPLLVSLFTDCTPPATCAMLTIMQEYTEVTMVMGSSANADNMRLFMQADASLSVDPLYPQVCMREAVFVRPPLSKGPPPTEVARSLNVLPCSLAFQRDDRVSLVHLIMESRHYMQQVMSCVQFWACCCLSLTFLQLLAATAALPPLLSSGDVVWIVSVIIPIISVSLVAAPTNRAVMNQATGKNVVILNKQIFRYVVLYYICKFIPSVAVILLCGGLTLASFCWDITSQHNSSCIYVYPNAVPIVYNNSTKYDEQRSSWSGWGDKYADSLDAVQNGVAFLLVLYFCMISISFVHRMYQLWTKNPLTNRWWASSVIAVLVLQIVYGSVSLSGSRIASRGPGLSDIPAWLWLMAFIWPFLLIPLNEVIKRREIRVNVRYQKRARLEFGTKLGMNSPF